MNLRVDLILETEQRSASVVNAKMLLRIVYIVVPLILAVMVATLTVKMIALNSELSNLNAEMGIKGPKKDAALKLRGELEGNKALLAQLEGWNKSQVKWSELLRTLQKQVPPALQLTSVRIMDTLQTAGGPSRNYNIILKGKGYGDATKNHVIALEASLKQWPEMAPPGDAKVVNFGQDEQSPRKDEMMFQIECTLLPRRFQ